ncbi:uncharacterized protein LAJ45_03257 [Morchella importuna]|uniref:uncharacterized protein n=1 Tax=Morchella importuna TaxID=1174673 RepID=UPI001E8D773F|nr:uncharacterized protein LAJ45_03257 [Morchella importuna]KAH8152417.1 hypothetical protein LAJ45_03257 [Morchella importuna]
MHFISWGLQRSERYGTKHPILRSLYTPYRTLSFDSSDNSVEFPFAIVLLRMNGRCRFEFFGAPPIQIPS